MWSTFLSSLSPDLSGVSGEDFGEFEPHPNSVQVKESHLQLADIIEVTLQIPFFKSNI